MSRVVLASSSEARRDLLAKAGVVFRGVDPSLDEELTKRTLAPLRLTPAALAEELAILKALSVSVDRQDIVIGADRTLEIDGLSFDKVEDLAGARERLERLRGRGHDLHTAVALARNGEITWRMRQTSTLTMRGFSNDFLESYLLANHPQILSSVGCYLTEGAGAQLFDTVEGDVFAIRGLPLVLVLVQLRSAGGLSV